MGRVPVTSNAGRDIAPVGLPSRCLVPDTGSEGLGFRQVQWTAHAANLPLGAGARCMVMHVGGGHSIVGRMATELGCEMGMQIR